MRLIKRYVSTYYGDQLALKANLSASRQSRGERNLWQRRFWEHTIRDQADFTAHCDYLHYNPVKHKLWQQPGDWAFSSFHRLV